MKISPTAAGTYLDCPRRYWFEYVLRPRPRKTGGPWAHESLGLSVHNALADWMVYPPEERTPRRALSLLTARWIPTGYRDDAQVADFYTRASEWVEAYTARPEVQGAHVIGNERNTSGKYNSKHGLLIAEGRIDRIDWHPGGERGRLVVVDYKVGKRAPDEADATGSTQLAVYAYATTMTLGRGYGWCTRAELHHLPSGTVVGVDYDKARMHRLLDRLADVAHEIEGARAQGDAEAFPARPSALCGMCPFLDVCAAGKERAQRADSWAGLPA